MNRTTLCLATLTVFVSACTNVPPDDDEADAGAVGVPGAGLPTGGSAAMPSSPAPGTTPGDPAATPPTGDDPGQPLPGGTPAPGPGPGPGGTGSDDPCPENPNKYALTANHIIAQISWPANTGVEGGSGTLHVWTMTELHWDAKNPDGTVPVTGTVQPCGSVIPALTKSALAGGGQVQTVIPDDVWDAPSMPQFEATGVLGGFGPGSAVTMEPVASLVGASLPDPANSPWPANGKDIVGVDHDGDGQPGILARPRTDAGFAAPPVSFLGAIDPNAPRASELYLATRTMVKLDGTRDTCDSASGPAQVLKFESHVIGCRRNDGAVCNTDEATFIDSNQPTFTVGSATYEMKQLPDGATCADVRALLPM
jgi:hypothetical protein